MLPNKHIFFGTIFSVALFLIFPKISVIGLFTLFISSFMIDIDHYIYYIFRKKNLNPIKAYHWYMENRKKFYSLSSEKRKSTYGGLYVLHGLGFLFILLFLGFFVYNLFLLVFVGFLFHEMFDWYEEIKLDCRPIKLFLIRDFLESKKLKHIEDM
jgi:hypothetical protein